METGILSTSNVVYVDRDFTNAQFGSKIFDKCTFRNYRFDGMDLSGVTFKVCTAKAVEKHLAKLKAEGIIEREGPDKGGSRKVK